MAKIIGIDLGTTYSAVAFLEGGKAEIIPNSEGARTTPSVVAFTKEGELVVGEVAKRQAVVNPENTVYSIKRLMGRAFEEVGTEIARVPYKVERGSNNKPVVKLPHASAKEFPPEEISAFILQKLKKDAEAFLGEPVTKAVITVPAYFNDSQRQATKDAGRIAGLEVLRIINEPTASALAYGLDKKQGQTILVFDLGGGTFDVTVLEFGDGVFEVKATHGDNHLGGDDFDEALMRFLAEEFKRQHGVDLMKDRTAMQRLKEASEKAKKELSTLAKTNVNLPYIAVTADGPKHIDMDVSRAQFEAMSRELVERCRGPVQQALKDANITADRLDEVILVGGSTRIPAVQELVKSLTGKEPNKTVNPDEAVALGAAIQGGVISGEVTDLLLLDVTPLSLGIETLGSVFTKVIDRNTTIPTKRSRIFSTASDLQTSVEVHVLQGERPMATANKSLGRFHLDGIPPAPRGVPQIEVAFDIDANGILNVSAKDLGTGRAQKITVTGSTRLSDDEVKRATEEAKKFEQEDQQRVLLVNARNDLDNLCYAADRALREAGDKASSDLRGRVEKAVAQARGDLATDDLPTIQRRTQELSAVVQELGTAIYAQAQAAAQQAGPPGAGAQAEPEFEVVTPKRADAPPEGEFEVVRPAKGTKTKKGEGPDSIDVDYDVDK